MAKKVRTRLEGTAESQFEFPVFDERAFIDHELELTWAMLLAVGMAAAAGVLSGLLSIYGGSGLTVAAPVGIGLLTIIFSPYLIGRLRARSHEYTRGDWAGLIALELFGWLGLWFLLAGAFGSH